MQTWTAEIYKDAWHGTSKPWCADLIDPDGKRWKSYGYAFRSRKALERMIEAATPSATQMNFVRAKDRN